MSTVTFAILYAIYNKPLPQGKSGIAADSFARKMLKALNYEAYKDTRYVEWSFKEGKHRYKWDKQLGVARVEWDDYRVVLNLANPAKSSVFENDIQVTENSRTELIKTAVSNFNNDSFWLVAPFKVFDSGTERSLVTLEDGSDGLLITYTSGGTTPGDSYLWKLGKNRIPESFQMWVEIIPIGGLEATWGDWQVMESGVFLPICHKLGPMDFKMEDVKAYN
ncbi:hypothetical protein [Pricia antarctica]|uniref:hypothetical protein n=1 Tax=Pricia antarctica TaxID=641691 RepID=UPI001FE05FBB|nr:hypothetical protein [Pricia antarctica]